MSGPLPVNGGASIYFHDGDGLVVRYNTILGPVSSALYSHATNLEIYGNVIAGAAGTIHTSASSRIFNNTFYEVAAGVSGGTIEARNNIFVMLDGTSPFGGVSDLTASHNLVVGAEAPDGALSGEPRFEDPESWDFRLGASSDAVDAGIDVGLTVDRVGTPLPQGAGFDLGAFERPE